nr:immunoglobulin superfamily member 23 isoform X3 [Aotus nancymaae]
MRSPLDVSSGHTPAWRKLLLTGILLTSCTCSAFSELPFSTQLNTWTEGASAHLPVPGSLDGILTTSWFRGHDAQPAAMIFSPEGLPGPAHTGREMLRTQGSLVIRNVTAQDSGSYTVVLETSRGRRSATEQIHVKNSFPLPQLKTFPEAFQGVIQTELNYSVILQWMVIMDPEPVPTEPEPMEPDPTLSLSGSAAISFIVAGILGAGVLIGGLCFTIIQSLRRRTSSRNVGNSPVS